MLTYLALGDSYTIGEQVPPEENFPNLTARILREKYKTEVENPKIVAVTGWTTDELAHGIKEAAIKGTYDFVTLLIGVNNQYRGRSVENYKEEFTKLLEQAIVFANGRSSRVFVLSIPDWGVTPFAEGKDHAEIAKQIDAYNQANMSITRAFHCHYLDITHSTRIHGTDESYLVADKLHYSGKEYEVWAEPLASQIQEALKH